LIPLSKRREWWAKNKVRLNEERRIKRLNNPLSDGQLTRIREYKKLWARNKRAQMTEKEKESLRQKNAEWMRQERKRNPQKVRAREKTGRAKRVNVIKQQRASPKAKAKAAEYIRNRVRTDLNFRIVRNLRSRLYKAVNSRVGTRRVKSTFDLVGCSPEYLWQYLQNRFIEGMNWSNYGQWQIDHIRPVSTFDLINPEEQIQCFHYSNLQPLWRDANQKKERGLRWNLMNIVEAQ
jgi:hypothetical protein